MEIETLARKLEPLLPAEVSHWLRLRDGADPELKNLVDRQIVAAAHRVLGDYRKKILLSLPPERLARGEFHLGTVLYEKEKWPVGISRGEFLQNMAIFGRSGAGKTNVAFHLLNQLTEKKIPWLFLDWKRTGRHLIPQLHGGVNLYTPSRSLSPFPFNPFLVPPGMEPSAYVNILVDVMADAYTLGDGARTIVQKAIAACYAAGNHAPSVAEIMAEAEKLPEKDRMRGWKISALRALESLAFAEAVESPIPKPERGNLRESQEGMARKLLHESTIIELDALSQASKKFLIPLLCLWLYYVKLGSRERERLGLVILVEEAHHLLYRNDHRAQESVMEMLLKMCRELGIAMIVIDQHPSLISKAALGNTFTSICLNLKDPGDISRAAGISLVPAGEKQVFGQLPVGEGIVKLQDRWRRPFLVKFPLMEIDKGAMNDEALKRYLAELGSDSGANSSKIRGVTDDTSLFSSPRFDRIRRIHPLDRPLSQGALRFLEDVLTHEDDGVRQRYLRLGMSGARGNRLKRLLIEQGWLEAKVVQAGSRGRKLLLRLSRKGREFLGIEAEAPREGLAHAYWKRFYARRFEDEGWNIQMEAPRARGFVDILAEKRGLKMGIEIETGKSGAVSNVKNGLKSKFDRVAVIATDPEAFRKVERELGSAGLLGIERVKLILAGDTARVTHAAADSVED